MLVYLTCNSYEVVSEISPSPGVTKHLIIGPKGNSEFCFPRFDPQCSPRLRLKKTKLTVSHKASHQVFCFIPNSKIEQTAKKKFLDDSWHTLIWTRCSNWPPGESKVCSPWRFARELVSFDPWHVACFLPIRKRNSLGGRTKCFTPTIIQHVISLHLMT